MKELLKKFRSFLMDLYQMNKHMKVILFLILPFITVGQSSQLFEWGASSAAVDGVNISWEYLGTTSNSSKPVSDLAVGDTIVMAIDMDNRRFGTNEVRFYHIDVNWNTKLLTKIWDGHQNQPTDAQISDFTQNGYKWTRGGTGDEHYYMNWQWDEGGNNGGGYNANADWIVTHYQAQTATGTYGGPSGHLVKIHFKINAVDSSFNFNEPALFMTMAKANDPASGWTFAWKGGLRAYPTGDINIKVDNNEYADGTVLVEYDGGANFDPSTLKAYLYYLDEAQNVWNVWENLSFDVPADGKIDLTGIKLTKGVKYALTTHAKDGTAYRALYDDIVTIADLALLFKATGESGLTHDILNTTLPYKIQVKNGDFDYSGTIDEKDTYKLMAHLFDIETFETSTGGTYEPQSLYYWSLSAYLDSNYNTAYENASFNVTGGHLTEIDFDFEATTQQINLKVAHKGDVNLSHSADPSVTQTVASRSSLSSYGQFKRAVTNAEGTFVTELKDGKVVATITIPDNIDFSAIQFRIGYDDTKLTFAEAKLDTGNTTTNFAKHAKGYINVGGINLEKEKIKNGIIELVFTPNVSITNTIGLVTVNNVDATDMNADLINLKLK